MKHTRTPQYFTLCALILVFPALSLSWSSKLFVEDTLSSDRPHFLSNGVAVGIDNSSIYTLQTDLTKKILYDITGYDVIATELTKSKNQIVFQLGSKTSGMLLFTNGITYQLVKDSDFGTAGEGGVWRFSYNSKPRPSLARGLVAIPDTESVLFNALGKPAFWISDGTKEGTYKWHEYSPMSNGLVDDMVDGFSCGKNVFMWIYEKPLIGPSSYTAFTFDKSFKMRKYDANLLYSFATLEVTLGGYQCNGNTLLAISSTRPRGDSTGSWTHGLFQDDGFESAMFTHTTGLFKGTTIGRIDGLSWMQGNRLVFSSDYKKYHLYDFVKEELVENFYVSTIGDGNLNVKQDKNTEIVYFAHKTLGLKKLSPSSIKLEPTTLGATGSDYISLHSTDDGLVVRSFKLGYTYGISGTSPLLVDISVNASTILDVPVSTIKVTHYVSWKKVLAYVTTGETKTVDYYERQLMDVYMLSDTTAIISASPRPVESSPSPSSRPTTTVGETCHARWMIQRVSEENWDEDAFMLLLSLGFKFNAGQITFGKVLHLGQLTAVEVTLCDKDSASLDAFIVRFREYILGNGGFTLQSEPPTDDEGEVQQSSSGLSMMLLVAAAAAAVVVVAMTAVGIHRCKKHASRAQSTYSELQTPVRGDSSPMFTLATPV